MRKQSMSLILAALMIGGSLAGCSGSKPAETTAASTEAAKTEAAETTAETTAGAEISLATVLFPAPCSPMKILKSFNAISAEAIAPKLRMISLRSIIIK